MIPGTQLSIQVADQPMAGLKEFTPAELEAMAAALCVAFPENTRLVYYGPYPPIDRTLPWQQTLDDKITPIGGVKYFTNGQWLYPPGSQFSGPVGPQGPPGPPGVDGVDGAGVDEYVELLDAASANLPMINTPLANALGSKANLFGDNTFSGDQTITGTTQLNGSTTTNGNWHITGHTSGTSASFKGPVSLGDNATQTDAHFIHGFISHQTISGTAVTLNANAQASWLTALGLSLTAGADLNDAARKSQTNTFTDVNVFNQTVQMNFGSALDFRDIDDNQGFTISAGFMQGDTLNGGINTSIGSAHFPGTITFGVDFIISTEFVTGDSPSGGINSGTGVAHFAGNVEIGGNLLLPLGNLTVDAGNGYIDGQLTVAGVSNLNPVIVGGRFTHNAADVVFGDVNVKNAWRTALGVSPDDTKGSVILDAVTTLAITAISSATAAVVTTAAAHGLTTGKFVHITGSNSTPSINGLQPVTVLSPTTFSIPPTTTGAGTTGTVRKDCVNFVTLAAGDYISTWSIHGFDPGGGSSETFLGTHILIYQAIIFSLVPLAHIIYAGEETSPILTGEIYQNPGTGQQHLVITGTSTLRNKVIGYRRIQ